MLLEAAGGNLEHAVQLHFDNEDAAAGGTARDAEMAAAAAAGYYEDSDFGGGGRRSSDDDDVTFGGVADGGGGRRARSPPRWRRRGSRCSACGSCSSRRGWAGPSNGTTTIVNGKCVCDSRFNGGDCSEIATCQYWDFATEMWSGEGCEIQLQVHRRAARAGDRSAVRRCASARADRPASRSPRRRAAARSATARTSRTSRASRRRWCHPGLGLSQ